MEKILDIDTILNFGKHKGKTVKQLIIPEHISYIYWLKEETDWVLSENVKDAIRAYIQAGAGYRAYTSNYKHDASYGQAFDRCAGGLMY